MLELVFAFLIAAAQAQETTGAKKDAPAQCNLRSKLAGPADPLLHRLKGMVEFVGPCSASLITLPGRSKSEKGLILTSGHCVRKGRVDVLGQLSAPADGEVFYQAGDDRTFTLDTGNAAAPRACLRADQLVYATMTGLDVAVFRVTESYEEIERRTGVGPFVLAKDTEIPPGIKVHVPSALHQNNQVCATGTTIPGLKEFVWSWAPVLRVTPECKVLGGASGSPVVREDTNEVIGVMGTVYDGTSPPCELMNPCELDDKGTSTVAKIGQPYVHFVHRLQSCSDARGDIDLKTPGCMLPKP